MEEKTEEIIQDKTNEPESKPDMRQGCAILVPVASTIPGLFLASFARAYVSFILRGWSVTFFIADAVPLQKARELLLNDATKRQVQLTYMLWLDSDMMVTEEHIDKLVDYMEANQDVDAVSALYFKRKPPYEPVCYRKIDIEDSTRFAVKEYMPKTNEPTEVEAAGLGCMLVRTSSLKEKLLSNFDSRRARFWFDGVGSEDVNFCLLMRSAGMKIMVLPDVVVPHHGGQVTRWHYEKMKEEKG